MKVTALLGAYVVLMTTAAPWAFARLSSLARAPRLGVALWQACAASVVGSLVLVLVIDAPDSRVAHRLAAAFALCIHTGHRLYAITGWGVLGATALVVMFAVAGRIMWSAWRVTRASSRRRTRHRDIVALLGRSTRHDRLFVLESTTPMAYCLPGRRGCVVLTSSALVALDQQQLAAVLVHERTHLSERHDLVVGAFDVLVAAFPFVGGFRLARDQVARFVELIADDAAVRSCGREALSGALLRLSPSGPVGLLGAGGPGVAGRIERLVDPRSASVLARVGILSLAIAIFAVPAVLVLLPAVNPWAHGICPL